MIISTPLACCSITYSAAQLLIATAQLAYPDYAAAVWHVYLVYVAMMFISYVIICLPTRYVSWFNIWASMLGIVVLIVSTIILPAMAQELNSGKDIFTSVRLCAFSWNELLKIPCSCTTKLAGQQVGPSA